MALDINAVCGMRLAVLKGISDVQDDDLFTSEMSGVEPLKRDPRERLVKLTELTALSDDRPL